MKAITEQTRISLYAAIIAIGGGAIWLTTLYLRVEAHGSAIAQLDRRDKMTVKRLYRMDRALYKLQLKSGIEAEAVPPPSQDEGDGE